MTNNDLYKCVLWSPICVVRVRSRIQEVEGEQTQERFFRPHFLQAPGDLLAHEGRLCRLDCKVGSRPSMWYNTIQMLHFCLTLLIFTRWVDCQTQNWCGWSTGDLSIQTSCTRCWCERMVFILWLLTLWHRMTVGRTPALQATKQAKAPLVWNWKLWVRNRYTVLGKLL